MSVSLSTQSITLLIPAGQLPLEVMQKAHELATQHNLEIYLSTLQNLRLNNVPDDKVAEVKAAFVPMGIKFKAMGMFPLPKVCVGQTHCKLGVIDTNELSNKILDHFADRKTTKAKIKIAIAACNLACSGTRITDIGIEATRKGYTIFAGGKGGIAPKVGRRIKRDIDEQEVIDTIQQLIDFHDKKTGKKQRMYKLLADQEFPFPAI